jgi:hypothetical protein
VWFNTCWIFASCKDGIAALNLKHSLEFGSVQPAWTHQHRLRSVLVRPGREWLTGTVEWRLMRPSSEARSRDYEVAAPMARRCCP